MKDLFDQLEFASGRRVSVNCGIVGIDDRSQVYHGYDENIDTPCEGEFTPSNPLTRQECVELADFMAVRWMRFRELHAKEIK